MSLPAAVSRMSAPLLFRVFTKSALASTMPVPPLESVVMAPPAVSVALPAVCI